MYPKDCAEGLRRWSQQTKQTHNFVADEAAVPGKEHGQEETGSDSVEEAGVAVVPGGPFGADAYVRLSYACSIPQIEKGVGRFAEWLGDL